MLTNPNLIDTYQKADALLSEGKLQQAADICKQMLENNPNFAYGYHLMASLFRSTGNLDKALTFADLAIKLDGNVPSFYMQQGQILLSLAHFEAAGMAFEKARQLQPGKALYIVLCADACVHLGHYERAIELFAQARDTCVPGEMPEIDEHEGLFMLALGNVAAAEQLFDKVIAARPTYYAGYLHKGKILLYGARDHEAETCFAKAINCNPHSFEALHGMAVINERQGQIDSAIAFAIQAINANGSLFDSLVLLGTLLLRKQNWGGAEQIFRQALSVIPDNIYALQGFAAALLPQKKMQDVRDYVWQIMAAKPDSKVLAFFNDVICGQTQDAAPQEYTCSLFNEYASRYDFFLQPLSSYRAPTLSDMLRGLTQLSGKIGLSLLDLGCGNGALGEELHDITEFRIGVDLSARMLDIARTKRCYNDLYALDITEFAMGSDRMFDIVAALDVLPYIGRLEHFFRAARNLVASGSILAFTTEKEEGDSDFTLQMSGRYRHSTAYILSLLAEHGYEIILRDEILLRFDYGQPVRGEVFAVKKMTVH